MNLLQKAAMIERSANARPSRIGEGAAHPAVTDHPSIHRPVGELNRRELAMRLEEAEEQLREWDAQRARARTQADRDKAGARVLLWQSEIVSIKRAALTAPAAPLVVEKEDRPDPSTWVRYITACVVRSAAAQGTKPEFILATTRGNGATASARVIAMIASVQLGIPRDAVAKAFRRERNYIDQLFASAREGARPLAVYAQPVAELLATFGIHEDQTA